MRKKWTTEKKWESSKSQKYFEKYLNDNGYKITGYQEYISFTKYKIQKDNMEIEYQIYNDAVVGKTMVKCFEDYWNTCAEYHQLKALAKEKGF